MLHVGYYYNNNKLGYVYNCMQLTLNQILIPTLTT